MEMRMAIHMTVDSYEDVVYRGTLEQFQQLRRDGEDIPVVYNGRTIYINADFIESYEVLSSLKLV